MIAALSVEGGAASDQRVLLHGGRKARVSAVVRTRRGARRRRNRRARRRGNRRARSGGNGGARRRSDRRARKRRARRGHSVYRCRPGDAWVRTRVRWQAGGHRAWIGSGSLSRGGAIAGRAAGDGVRQGGIRFVGEVARRLRSDRDCLAQDAVEVASRERVVERQARHRILDRLQEGGIVEVAARQLLLRNQRCDGIGDGRGIIAADAFAREPALQSHSDLPCQRRARRVAPRRQRAARQRTEQCHWCMAVQRVRRRCNRGRRRGWGNEIWPRSDGDDHGPRSHRDRWRHGHRRGDMHRRSDMHRRVDVDRRRRVDRRWHHNLDWREVDRRLHRRILWSRRSGV